MTSKALAIAWPSRAEVQRAVEDHYARLATLTADPDAARRAAWEIDQKPPAGAPLDALLDLLTLVALHGAHGVLDDEKKASRHVKALDDLVRLASAHDAKGKMAALERAVHLAKASCLERTGNWDEAAWERYAALQVDDGGVEAAAPAVLRALLATAARAGQTRLAFEALAALAVGNTPQTGDVVTEARLWRLSGETLRAEALLSGLDRDDGASWELAVMEVSRTSRLDRMLALLRERGRSWSAARYLEAMLWARSLKGREWWERLVRPSTIKTRCKDELKREPATRALLAAVEAVESVYDTGLPLSLRLEQAREALATAPLLATFEQELLLRAAIARALARHSQHSLATLVAQGYADRCRVVSGGASDDVLGLAADLTSRTLTGAATSGDETEGVPANAEAEADAGEPMHGIARYGKMASIAMSVAAQAATTKIRLAFAGQHERQRLRAQESERFAGTLLTAIGQLKGLGSKLSQSVGFCTDMLPPGAQGLLALAQDAHEPMPPSKARTIVEKELATLGKTIADSFAHFSEAPLAAASIGQVHRAELKDGKAVVVKVQYPRMPEIVRRDLAAVAMVRPFVATFAPYVNFDEMYAEVLDLVSSECDYRKERANQEQLKALLAGNPDVFVAAPVDGLCTDRILTMEYVGGEDFTTFARLAPQAERDRIGVALARFMYEGIFKHGLFYGDPHPGNFKIMEDGRLAVLDFGCVRAWAPDRAELYRQYHRAIFTGDRPLHDAVLEALGAVVDKKLYNFAGEWDFQSNLFLTPFLAKEPFKFERSFVREAARRMIADNPNKKLGTVPRDMVITARLSFGLYFLLAELGATAKWGEILRPLIDGPGPKG